MTDSAIVMAGIPATNRGLYHRVRFLVGDPTAWISLPQEDGSVRTKLILRDIEMQRARQSANADDVHCPADFAPESGLSGDRETATAQAVAECVRRSGVKHAIADRSLPLIYADQLQLAGIKVDCDSELGVVDRRAKSEQEVERLREAQATTEGAMEMACRLVAFAQADAEGVLQVDGEALTAERLRAAVDVWLLERGYSNPTSIIACGPQGADCHNYGSGALRTELPVIVDIFPQNRSSLYNGDCTRTVVNGEIPQRLAKMHSAVVAAKDAAIEATRAGVTGQAVHEATAKVIRSHGFEMGLPGDGDSDDYTAMTHGTGHGIGLDVHEPPLLDKGGPELVAGDALTIEPGLYSRSIGGVRVEDMVIVTDEGCLNLNALHGGLDWS